MKTKKKRNNKALWRSMFVIFLCIAVLTFIILVIQVFNMISVDSSRKKLLADVNSIEIQYLEKIEGEEGESNILGKSDLQNGVEDKTHKNLVDKYRFYEDTYGIEIPNKNLDFAKMQQEINSDIYAWLYIPGTNVDDPIVQHPTDDEYYLNHNLDGSEGYPGGIYTERCNAKDFSDRMTVVYGHNMKNGKAFGTIHSYEDAEFFNENRYIFVYTPEDVLVYEIFASYTGSGNHIIMGHDWNDISWVQYLNDTLEPIWDNHNALSGYSFTKNSKVITLSTCIRLSPNERYLVQGVLLDADR